MNHKDPLAIYLNDHHAGAAGGVALIERIARSHRGGDIGADLDRLAGDISDDRDVLREMMRRLGVGVSRYKVIGGWIAEKVGRLKSNGRILRRSPLSSVLETEAMLTGVHAKAAAWRLLGAVAERDSRLDRAELASLLARAEDQIHSLEQIRIANALKVFGAVYPTPGLAKSSTGTPTA